MNTATDRSPAELVRAAQDGDDTAWTGLVARYSGLLWSIGRAHGLDDADTGDLVQTVWLRLIERIDTLREPAAVGGWLAVTARHESLRLARLRAARPLIGVPQAAVPDAPDAPNAPEQVYLARERLRDVSSAIASLPVRCQTILRLLAFASMSYAELADALGIPIGSIGPTRGRCLNELRKRLPR